jgi:hypothetical protein
VILPRTTPFNSTQSQTNVDVFPPTRFQPTPQPNVAPSVPPSAPAASTDGSSPPPSGGRAQTDQNRTGKNPAAETVESCISLWEAGTHMSKAEWSATCRRIQNRLANINFDAALKNLEKRQKSSGAGQPGGREAARAPDRERGVTGR